VARPEENDVLKRLTRRRRRLVNERVRLTSVLHSDLQAAAPGLVEITRDVANLWFLNFLTCRKDLRKLVRIRRASLLKLPAIGACYADRIQAWQTCACFSRDAALVGTMIRQDALRVLELKRQIKALDDEIARVAETSGAARRLASIPGFGAVCSAELAGEIGTIARFNNEGSLALYLGMAPLDHSSGKLRGSKSPKHVNTRAKAAMINALDRHRKEVLQSQRYYETKRAAGKTHNQAIRALGRHLCRVIFKMLRNDRPYWIDPRRDPADDPINASAREPASDSGNQPSNPPAPDRENGPPEGEPSKVRSSPLAAIGSPACTAGPP
jgi:transposase